MTFGILATVLNIMLLIVLTHHSLKKRNPIDYTFACQKVVFLLVVVELQLRDSNNG